MINFDNIYFQDANARDINYDGIKLTTLSRGQVFALN